MVSSKSVLITGVAGFIGKNVAEYYSLQGWRVIGLDQIAINDIDNDFRSKLYCYYQNDLNGLVELVELIKREEPALCIHAAGSSDVNLSFDQPLADFRAQVSITYVLLEAIRISGRLVKTILVSSAAVYGNPINLPITESERFGPISPYGYHKTYQESVAIQYNKIYQLPIVITRLFSTFGPGQRKLAIWDITKRALEGELSVYGNGEQTRDYIYIEDVAKALFIIGESKNNQGEIYNIGSGEQISLNKLALLIGTVINPDLQLEHISDVKNGNPIKWCADITKLKKLGFVHQWSFKSALSNTVNWISRCR